MVGGPVLLPALPPAPCTPSEPRPAPAPASAGAAPAASRADFPAQPHLGAVKPRRATPPDKAACEALGGKWGRFGLVERDDCDLRSDDAGTECTDSIQCLSGCVADAKIPAGTETKGHCFERTIMRGHCENFVREGRAGGVRCVD